MGLTSWLLNFAISLIERIGYIGVFIILVLDNCGLPIPSEAVLALSGSVARSGQFNLLAIIAIGAIAQTLGTYLAYLIGHFGGEPVIKRYGKYVLISHHDYLKAHAWFEKRGERMILVSRLIPVIRTYVGFVAGTFNMDKRKFLIDSFIGSLIWTILWTGLGFALGNAWRNYYEYMHYLDYVVIAGVLFFAGRFVYRKVRSTRSKTQ